MCKDCAFIISKTDIVPYRDIAPSGLQAWSPSHAPSPPSQTLGKASLWTSRCMCRCVHASGCHRRIAAPPHSPDRPPPSAGWATGEGVWVVWSGPWARSPAPAWGSGIRSGCSAVCSLCRELILWPPRDANHGRPLLPPSTGVPTRSLQSWDSTTSRRSAAGCGKPHAASDRTACACSPQTEPEQGWPSLGQESPPLENRAALTVRFMSYTSSLTILKKLNSG